MTHIISSKLGLKYLVLHTKVYFCSFYSFILFAAFVLFVPLLGCVNCTKRSHCGLYNMQTIYFDQIHAIYTAKVFLIWSKHLSEFLKT
jgi:hypothetical protein